MEKGNAKAAQWEKLLFVLLLGLVRLATGHAVRETVPTSVRAQQGSKRTEWHDVSARHCPLFAHDSSVAMPLPGASRAPSGSASFKLQLAFDAGRVLTPWVDAPIEDQSSSPIIAITLAYSGDTLLSATASSEGKADESVHTHSQHQSLGVIRYYWHKDAEFDSGKASLCVVALCTPVAFLLVYNALRHSHMDEALSMLMKPMPRPENAYST